MMSLTPMPPRFGAVYRNKPVNEPSQFFQPVKEDNDFGSKQNLYATGDDKDQLKSMFSTFNSARKLYNQTKELLLKNTGQLSANQITIIVGADMNKSSTKPGIAERKASDRVIEERCYPFDGFKAFIEARNAFENLEQDCIELMDTLAQKAQ